MDRTLEPTFLVNQGVTAVAGAHARTVLMVVYFALYVTVVGLLVTYWDSLNQFVLLLALYFTLSGNPLFGVVVLSVAVYKNAKDESFLGGTISAGGAANRNRNRRSL